MDIKPQPRGANMPSKVDQLAYAIAVAEGFYAAGSLPSRINNPGDLELGDRGWGTDGNKTVYPKADLYADISDWTDGYSALRREIHAIFAMFIEPAAPFSDWAR